MPYINIKVTDEGMTKEQKLRLIQGVTKLMVDVLNKDPKTTHVIIDEIKLDNWGYDNDQTSEIRKRQSKR
jgi:4-oxalocrotonate tautomerase